jgi:methyl-accepting chemotaxis protein
LRDFDQLKEADGNSVTFMASPTMKQAGLESPETYVFYHPAYSSENVKNGAFVAILDWNEIDRLADEFRKELTGFGFETAATLMLFPDDRAVMSTSYQGSDDNFEQACRGTDCFALARDKEILEAEIGGTEALLSSSGLRTPSVTNGRAEHGATPLLTTAVPITEITGQLYKVMLTIGIIAALGAVAVILTSYFIARRMSRSIGRLTEISLKIAEGDIDNDIDVTGKDEIGELAGAYGSLVGYISEMAQAAQRVAAKDFTVEVKPKSSRDVLGSSFKAMTESLSDVIRQIADSTHVLASAASEITSTSEQMTKGARNQADRVAQVSTAIEEMASSIIEASKNSDSAASASKNSSDTAKGGGEIVSETISGMRQISDVIRKSAENITLLANSVDEIGKIVSVIDDIADQTNLLALNAAIEAARAGEQGRGFAVVADEVRKLAERTGKATGEITSMISGIQKQTDEVVNSMETGIQEVDKGRELADKAGTSLSAVVDMSQKLMEMIQQIAAASQEQSSGAEVIAKNVEDISAIATATASGAEQSAQASAELNKQTEDLKRIVTQFRVKATQ